MTIVSKGYSSPGDDTINNVAWARLQQVLGQRYMVTGPDALTCTPVQAGTRQVTIGTGYFGGYGVLDQVSAAETVSLPTVASGTTYFMIVARRTWQTTQATTLTYINAGTTGNVTLPSRNTDPGTLDDQPLWMVPLTAGDTVPGTPIPLGVYGTAEGRRYIRSELALQYLNFLGAEVVLGDVTYHHRINAAGTGTEWVKSGPYIRSPLTTYSGAQVFGPSSSDGWDVVSGEACTAVRDRNAVSVDLAVRRTGEALQFGSDGGLSDSFIGSLTTDFRPPRPFTTTAQMQGGPSTNLNASFTCNVSVSNSGAVFVTDGPANLLIPKRTTVTDWSLRIHIPFLRGDAS